MRNFFRIIVSVLCALCFVCLTACGNDIDEVYEVIKPFVKHVHLKDAVREDGKTKIRTLGEGGLQTQHKANRKQQQKLLLPGKACAHMAAHGCHCKVRTHVK